MEQRDEGRRREESKWFAHFNDFAFLMSLIGTE